METGTGTSSGSKIPLAAPPGRGALVVGHMKRRGWALAQLLLRLVCVGAAATAAITMGTADERLSVFSNAFQFEARYHDIPAFTFFVVANAVVGGYLLLSLVAALAHVLRPDMLLCRLLLLPTDAVMAALQASAAGAAASMTYLAVHGNNSANWFSICGQFGQFCHHAIFALVLSFSGLMVLLFVILLSSASLFSILTQR